MRTSPAIVSRRSKKLKMHLLKNQRRHLASTTHRPTRFMDRFTQSTTQCGRGESIPYGAIVHVFEQIEGTRKRLEIEAYLCAFLRSVIALSPESLLACVYLACNQVAPGFENVELGLGEALPKKSIVQTTGTNLSFIKKKYAEMGDLGLVAQHYRGKQKQLMFTKPKPLKLQNVIIALRKLLPYQAANLRTKGCHQEIRLFKSLRPSTLSEACKANCALVCLSSTVLKALKAAFSMTSTTKLDRRVGMNQEKFKTLMEARRIALKQAFSEILV